jgi:hypothetical protein
MPKCIKCGATWTTTGLALCPICGHKVDAAPEGPADRPKPELAPVRVATASAAATPRLHRGTTVRIPPDPLPAPAKSSEEKAAPAPRPAAAETKDEGVRPIPPPPAPARRLEPSVKILATGPMAVPLLERPPVGPLVLGALSLVAGILLPLTLTFEGNRIFGVLGFCMSGFFAPFAPVGWIAGLIAERRRSERGLEPEPRIVAGRLLGQWGTLLLIGEMTVGLILVAGLRLAGRLPSTFWAVTF